jgi:hypothetical protein
MSAFNELEHIAGPAIVTFDSQVWYSEGDIDVDIQQSTWEPSTSRFGNLGPRIKSLPVGKVSFKPSGMVTSGLAAKAFPYGLGDVGKSIFGASDKTLAIQTLAGKLYTFQKAALMQVPGLVLAADKTAWDGTIAFMVITKTNTAPTTAGSFLAITTVAFADVSFDDSKVLSPGYTAAYGASFTAIESLDGFRVECPIRISEKSVNSFGVIGAYLTGIGPARCRFTPAGMTEANWLTLANAEGASVRMPGVPVGSGSTDLVISGTGLTVTLNKAGIDASKLAFGTDKERLGEVVFETRAVFAAGVPGSLVTIAVA